MKINEKEQAKKLRLEGKSYNEILRLINISKSTLSLWLRDIPLTEKQIAEKFSKRQAHIATIARKKRLKKIEKVESIKLLASKEAPTKYTNPLFLAGLMLYWAEGDKSTDVEAVKFTNSDPKMIEFMMCWFRNICEAPENKFHIALHIHSLHIENNITEYWSKITQIPILQFHKTQIKKTTLNFRRKPLYQGTCSIRICDRNLFRKIAGWKNGLLEIFAKLYYNA